MWILFSISQFHFVQDKLNERDLQKMEAAREAYIAAVAAAKENPDEASLSAASTARSYLQSLVLRT